MTFKTKFKSVYYWIIVSKKDEEPYDNSEGFQFYPDRDSAEEGFEDEFWDELTKLDYKIIRVRMVRA